MTATGREAEDLAAALRSLLPSDGVVEYPAWETLPHERLSPRSDTVGRRLAVLRRLTHPRPDDPETGPVSVVVAPVRSVLQPQVKGLGDLEPVALRTGETADLNRTVEALAAAAYSRVELVEKRGEFAVRGGILDVFPPTEEHPSGWSSGATTSRRSGTSRSPTRDRWRSPRTACGRRPAVNSSSPTTYAPARVPSPNATRNWANSSTRSPRASPSKGWNPSLRSSSTTWNC